MRMGGLDRDCNKGAPFVGSTMDGMDFAIRTNRVVNVVNRANSNGSALIRRLGNVLGPASNRVLVSRRGV